MTNLFVLNDIFNVPEGKVLGPKKKPKIVPPDPKRAIFGPHLVFNKHRVEVPDCVLLKKKLSSIGTLV